MSFHLAAFSPTGGTIPQNAYTEIQPVSDAVITTNPATTRFSYHEDIRIFAAYAGGANGFNARLYVPSRVVNHVRPVNSSVVPASPPILSTFLDYPMVVPKTSDILMEGYQTGA